MSLFIFPSFSLLSQVLVVGTVIYTRSRLTYELKVLGAYFVIGLGFDSVQLALALENINNLETSHLFFPIQFALLMLVFYYWNRQSLIGKLIVFAIPPIIVAWSIGSIWLGNLANTLTYVDPISAVILILVSSYTLLTIDRLEGGSVFDIPAFWISSATIIYYGVTVVLSSLATAFLKTPIETMRLAWSIQAIATILANLLYAGGFLCLRRKT